VEHSRLELIRVAHYVLFAAEIDPRLEMRRAAQCVLFAAEIDPRL
jgi:hypothetical protein